MKKITLLLCLICTIPVFSHQDKYYEYTYDNVTVMIKTGYYFEEINNIKIIGQYAAMLSKKMNYEEEISVYFEHDYAHKRKGENFDFLSYGLEYLVFDDDNKQILYAYDESLENQKKRITIQQFGFHYKISNTLKILYYAIKNVNNLDQEMIVEDIPNFYHHDFITSIPQNSLDLIKNIPNESIEQLLTNKVFITPVDDIPESRAVPKDVKYYSENDKYTLLIKPFIDVSEWYKVDTFEQIAFLDYTETFPSLGLHLIVFESNQKFHFYTNVCEQSNNQASLVSCIYKNLEYQNVDIFELIKGVDIRGFTEESLLVEYLNVFETTNDYKFVILQQEGKIVPDLMKYINSFKSKN